ncbi:MAG: sigma-54-dependent Fis family transcriptional regulator [Gammaproteobacteria bacterium]|nr:sigma-54-dependent Fis family transcriptional regulator [Gammaproteobacteria bacterium]
MHSALIIDDEPDIRELLEITLGRMQIACSSASDLRAAKALLKDQAFDICLTDMRLPDGDGIDLVAYIQRHYPALPVAVITAHGSIETAIQALKAGAFDFLTKPVDLNLLRTLVESALKVAGSQPKFADLLIGESKVVRDITVKISKLARSQAPVYISGESGVGKELVARMIHDQGPRNAQPFVPVNCGAIPHDLMESELFGHRRGSFTGATADKEGLFHAADGGTLFLDEVAELPLNMQVKLLRAIQEKKIRPVGDQRELPVNVRILSATHKNLAERVKQGAFREDLYYRINVIELHVPPLRKRREDIPALVQHILGRLSANAGLSSAALAPEALEILMRYDFPGNIRELENILERALTLCEGTVVRPEDLQLPERHADEGVPPGDGAGPDANLDDYLGDLERSRIMEALERTRWNRTAAAKLLGITFRQLRYRLKKLGLD